MTLDEAILHAEEKAKGKGPCAADHRQLAKWLRELKAYRAKNLNAYQLEKAADKLRKKEGWLLWG